MANKTIGELDLATSALSTDLMEMEVAASGLSKRITKANWVGANITGGGNIALGGFTLTVGANSTLSGNVSGSGTIATGGFTLTVPATGTAALRGAANTFTALNTFSSGISLGNEALTIYDEGTWVPEITAEVTPPTSLTYSRQDGRYTRIGDMVFFTLNITIATISGGAGDARFSLPFSASGQNSCAVLCQGMDFTGAATAAGVVFTTTHAAAFGVLYALYDDGSSDSIAMSQLAAGDFIWASGMYFRI